MAEIRTVTLVKGKGKKQDRRVVNAGSEAEAQLRADKYRDEVEADADEAQDEAQGADEAVE